MSGETFRTKLCVSSSCSNVFSFMLLTSIFCWVTVIIWFEATRFLGWCRGSGMMSWGSNQLHSMCFYCSSFGVSKLLSFLRFNGFVYGALFRSSSWLKFKLGMVGYCP